MLPDVYLSAESPVFLSAMQHRWQRNPSYHDSTPRNAGIITPREYTEILVLPQIKMCEPHSLSVIV